MGLNIDQITQIDNIQLVDNNGNLAVIKPASTAAIATDTALVVALSPNSPTPTGANTIGAVNQAGTWTVQQGTPPWSVVGNVASGVTDSGNPVKVAGVFNSIFPVLSNGQRGDIQLDSSARQIIAPLTNASIVKAQLQDNAGTGLTSTLINSKQRLDVNLPSEGVTGSAVPFDTVQVGGSDGTNLRTIAVDTSGRIVLSPVPNTGAKFSFGEITTSASAQVPVEFTTYTEPTSNSAMTIVSSSANDSSAGTGARTVTVTYLDVTGAGPNTTTFTMNGTSAVTAGVSNMCFIEKIVVTTVGSGGSNAGTLTLKTGGGATVGTIAVGNNSTFWAHHYVPTGKTTYITSLCIGSNGSSSGQGGTFILKMSTPTVANTPEIQISDFINIPGGVGSVTRLYDSSIQATGPARIRAYVTPSATSNYTNYASFDYIDN